MLADRGSSPGLRGCGRCRRFRRTVSCSLLLAGFNQPPVQRAERPTVRPGTSTITHAAHAAGRRAEARHLQPDAPDLAGRDLGLSEQLQGVRLERARVGGGTAEVEQLGAGVADAVPEVLPRLSNTLIRPAERCGTGVGACWHSVNFYSHELCVNSSKRERYARHGVRNHRTKGLTNTKQETPAIFLNSDRWQKSTCSPKKTPRQAAWCREL